MHSSFWKQRRRPGWPMVNDRFLHVMIFKTTIFRVHGEKNNIIYDLVKDFNVLDQSAISYPNVNFVSSSGKQIDNQKCGRLMALCLAILENSEKDLENYKDSLGSYVIKKYQEALKTPEFIDITADLSTMVLNYFHKFENSIEASDNWFQTSGNGYLQYWECEGHPLLNWKDKGYRSVIDFITVSINVSQFILMGNL